MRRQSLKNLVDSTSDPSFAVDGSGHIVAWNSAAEKYFAVTATDALGQSCSRIVQGTDECGAVCGVHCSTMQAMRQQRLIGSFDLMIQTPTGKKWCNIATLRADLDNSDLPCAVHVVREIEFRKRIELLMHDFVRSQLGLSAAKLKDLATLKRSSLLDSGLSAREQEVLKLIAKGAKTKSVALQLGISPSTVNNHVQHVLGKLGASNRLDAIRRAERSGLI